MEWTMDTDHQYTVTQGTYQGLVWQHLQGDWAGLISRDGSAVNQDTFPTLEETQAWCEAEIAARAAGGRCAP